MATKRPHFVPQTYLRAWTGSDGRLAYRLRDADSALLTSTRNVAVACGIYGTGELGQAREQAFWQLENDWPNLRQELITQGDLHGDRRSLFALFAATQLTRTRKHADRINFVPNVAASTEERPISQGAVHQYLQGLGGVEPDDAEVYAAWSLVTGAPAGELTLEQRLTIAANIAVEIAPLLQARKWTVRNFRQPALMTNDCPVHVWRRPSEDNVVGGVGIADADEVRFPLSPSALLVMTHGNKAPTNASARSVNAEICRQCHQFVVALPNTKGESVLDNLGLSKLVPRMRFRLINGSAGEILHTYVE